MSWDTVEGGGLIGSDGPVEVTIKNAYFGYDAGYQDGEQLLFILEGESPEADEPFTQFYSIGNGWDTKDGKVVTGRESFVTNTNYARFFLAALDIDASAIKALGDPADATIWKGQTFMMERRTYKMKFRDEEREFGVLVPVGIVKAKGKKAKKGKDGKSDTKALRAKIVKLAKKHDDHDDFLADVLTKYPEVEDSPLYDDVLEEDGIFEEVNG